MPQSEEAKERRKERDRLRYQNKSAEEKAAIVARAKERLEALPEAEQQARIEKRRENDRNKYHNMTPEQKEIYDEKQKGRYHARKEAETEEEADERRKNKREYRAEKREELTPEERLERNRKTNRKRDTMTPEQRQIFNMERTAKWHAKFNAMTEEQQHAWRQNHRETNERCLQKKRERERENNNQRVPKISYLNNDQRDKYIRSIRALAAKRVLPITVEERDRIEEMTRPGSNCDAWRTERMLCYTGTKIRKAYVTVEPDKYWVLIDNMMNVRSNPLRKSIPMELGVLYERPAVMSFVSRIKVPNNWYKYPVGFMKHLTLPIFGATPDLMLGDFSQKSPSDLICVEFKYSYKPISEGKDYLQLMPPGTPKDECGSFIHDSTNSKKLFSVRESSNNFHQLATQVICTGAMAGILVVYHDSDPDPAKWEMWMQQFSRSDAENLWMKIEPKLIDDYKTYCLDESLHGLIIPTDFSKHRKSKDSYIYNDWEEDDDLSSDEDEDLLLSHISSDCDDDYEAPQMLAQSTSQDEDSCQLTQTSKKLGLISRVSKALKKVKDNVEENRRLKKAEREENDRCIENAQSKLQQERKERQEALEREGFQISTDDFWEEQNAKDQERKLKETQKTQELIKSSQSQLASGGLWDANRPKSRATSSMEQMEQRAFPGSTLFAAPSNPLSFNSNRLPSTQKKDTDKSKQTAPQLPSGSQASTSALANSQVNQQSTRARGQRASPNKALLN